MHPYSEDVTTPLDPPSLSPEHSRPTQPPLTSTSLNFSNEGTQYTALVK